MVVELGVVARVLKDENIVEIRLEKSGRDSEYPCWKLAAPEEQDSDGTIIACTVELRVLRVQGVDQVLSQLDDVLVVRLGMITESTAIDEHGESDSDDELTTSVVQSELAVSVVEAA